MSSIISSKPASTLLGGEDGAAFTRGKFDGAPGFVSELYALGCTLATWPGALVDRIFANPDGGFDGDRLFVIVGTDDGRTVA